MASLTGKKVSESYKDLLQVSNSNSGVDATLRTVEDGEGTSAGIQLSATDTSFNGNHILKEQGKQSHIANTFASPYYFMDSATTDHIITAQTAILPSGASDRSVSAWVYPMDMTTIEVIVKWGALISNQLFNFCILGSDDNKIKVYGYGNDASQTGSERVVLNQWNHVACTYNGSNLLFYINGIFDSSVAFSTASLNTATPTFLYIGSYNAVNYNFGGSIGNAQVWNRVLSASEIKALYSGKSVPYEYKGANNTNIINNVEHSDWADGNTSHTDNQSDADGGTDAVLIVPSSATDNYFYDSALAVTKGKNYKFSVQLKSASGTPTIDIILRDNGTSNKTSQSCTLSTSWQTFEVERVAGASSLDVFIGGYESWTSSEGNIYAYKPEVSISGCVAEYDGTGVASDKWFDKSGNDLHATVSGAEVTNAPSADDGLVYEEGTWSPVFAKSDSISTELPMQAESAGKYVRVGNKVTITGQAIGGSSNGSLSASDTITIKGLPYPVPNEGANRSTSSSMMCFATALTAGERIVGYITQNTSQMDLYVNDDDTIFESGLRLDELTNAGHLIFSATYIIK